MRRVLVLGSPGAGKSTFALKLAEATGLPFVSLDALFWLPGWREPDRTAFGARMLAEAERPRWIMDGNYLSHGGPARLARADTVVWFDLPTVACLVGAARRLFASHGTVRAEMAPGCPERFELDFLRYVLRYRSAQRPKLVAMLQALRPDQRLVVFTRRSQARSEIAGATREPIAEGA